VIGYVVKRIAMLFPQLALVSSVVFVAMSVTPGDPVLMMLGPEATPTVVEEVRHDLGLDLPLYKQYWAFIKDVLRGDLGLSYLTMRPVTQGLGDVFPYTLQLTGVSFLLSSLIGILLGITGALRPHSFADNLIRIVSVSWFSIPVFWSGLMLILFFSVWLKWLPAFGAGSLRHLVLPAVSLALVSVGMLARMTRSSLLEVLAEDFIRTARAKGLGEQQVVLNHALRNAAISIVTILGLQLGSLLSGAVLSETVFARPGLGRYLVDAIFARDYPSIRGGILLLATIIMTVNLITDVAYTYLDPRIRYT
jgi:ABC-type dipeptide/oligopeptide/nickel transport system permease component